MDKRKHNGGAREGAGRKPKTEEVQLVEKLTPLDELALKALESALRAGEQWAVKLFMEFRWSKPKQNLEMDISSDGIANLIISPASKRKDEQQSDTNQ